MTGRCVHMWTHGNIHAPYMTLMQIDIGCSMHGRRHNAWQGLARVTGFDSTHTQRHAAESSQFQSTYPFSLSLVSSGLSLLFILHIPAASPHSQAQWLPPSMLCPTLCPCLTHLVAALSCQAHAYLIGSTKDSQVSPERSMYGTQGC